MAGFVEQAAVKAMRPACWVAVLAAHHLPAGTAWASDWPLLADASQAALAGSAPVWCLACSQPAEPAVQDD
jgi:hypothetical protein